MHDLPTITSPNPNTEPANDKGIPSVPSVPLGTTPPLSTHDLRYALLRLEVPLRPAQIPQLRRFVNLFVGQENDHFHNHRAVGRYLYRYPLVQYKTTGGKAALLGLAAAGVEALQQLARHEGFRQQCVEWLGEGFVWEEEHREQLCLYADLRHRYRLRQYIALNDNNLKPWHEEQGLAARTALLERCLVGHILKFASAIRWQLPPHGLQVELSDYRTRPVRSFDNPFLAFDITFRTNITLPEGIGLGKAVSHGFGIIEEHP